MAIPKIIGAQRDFSAGEVDESMKRADEMSAMKTGARQLSNFRILSGGQASNRPGRSVLFLESGRVEAVTMSPGNLFYLVFGNGYLRVYNAIGTQVAQSFVKGDGVTPLPWTATTANSIVFAIAPLAQPQVYITYGHDWPLNVPQVLTWDGVSQTSTWTLTNFAPALTGPALNIKRTLFDRISPPNIIMAPSTTSGVITLSTSAPVFSPGMVGTFILWCGREIRIDTYIDSQHVTAYCIEQLPGATRVLLGTVIDIGNGNSAFQNIVNGQFVVGDLVEGATSGARGIVTATGTQEGLGGSAQNPAPEQFQYIDVQIIPTTNTQIPVPYYLPGTIGFSTYFEWQEWIIGPHGSAQGGASITFNPYGVSVWDDEVMNNFRGWPMSVFYDQNRLGFCNFAQQPNAIAWSTVGLPLDFYVNGLATSLNADNAIYEKTPGGKVYFVVPGMESSEFVFCDQEIYYIPITSQLPLTPGSVSFNLLSTQGCFPNVQPKQIQQSILYVRNGGASLGAVQTPGYYFRPNIVDLASEFHSHLFTASTPVALAVPSGVSGYEESYAYLLRADGVIVMTRYLIKSGLIDAGPEGKPKMGWLPWTGVGNVKWISASGSELVFTSIYTATGDPWSNGWSNGFGMQPEPTVSLVEMLDETQSLDGAIYVNAPPAALYSAFAGPLWMYAGQFVQLMDGARPMSVYQVDMKGYIIPQFNDGENLASPTLIAGWAWTATLEPFVPDAPPGQAAGQRMNRRRVARMTTYVSNSTGFTLARLFSGPITATSPPLGTNMNFKLFPAWNQGDIVTNPPPLREGTYRWRPLGRSFDPRVAVIKNSPGPLLVHEIGFDVSI